MQIEVNTPETIEKNGRCIVDRLEIVTAGDHESIRHITYHMAQ